VKLFHFYRLRIELEMTDVHGGYPPGFSYWELSEYLTDIDLLIVGSGIVGLTTAIYYKMDHPEARVLVVEKGILPSGGSTKNAGFACFGSLGELLADMRKDAKENVFALVGRRLRGLSLLRSLIGDGTMCFDPCGGYELFGDMDLENFEACMELMSEANRTLGELYGLSHTYSPASGKIEEFGFRGVSRSIYNRYEGSIDTGKMMRALHRLAIRLDVAVLNGFSVKNWVSLTDRVTVEAEHGVELHARHVHFATNGWARTLIPELDVQPARAQVLITEPVDDLPVSGTFHMNEGFFYFRNVGHRLLLGGGRNLDPEGETTDILAVTENIQQELDRILREQILPGKELKVAHRWAGVMGVGNNKSPIVRRVAPGVSCAVRMGGMGVALGADVGKASAQLIGEG